MKTLTEKFELHKSLYLNLSPTEKQNLDTNFAIDFTYHSNAIEGNTCSLDEVKRIFKNQRVNKPQREIDEIINHYKAFQFIKEQATKKQEISENLIKDIHEKVLPANGIGGLYRTTNVYIRNALHVPPNPQKVRELMKFFIDDIKNKKLEIIEKTLWIHAEFVKIHPFPDGNGRTGRLLMNYYLLINNYQPILIKVNNKSIYFQALEQYSLNNDLNFLINLVNNTTDV